MIFDNLLEKAGKGDFNSVVVVVVVGLRIALDQLPTSDWTCDDVLRTFQSLHVQSKEDDNVNPEK